MDAFVRFWRHQRTLPGEPLALLLTSIRRAAWDLARREGRRTEREERASSWENDDSGGFVPPLLENLQRDALDCALEQLPPEKREVVVLKIWGELTLEQIAAQLNLPPGTVASRYRSALVLLREYLVASDCHG